MVLQVVGALWVRLPALAAACMEHYMACRGKLQLFFPFFLIGGRACHSNRLLLLFWVEQSPREKGERGTSMQPRQTVRKEQQTRKMD